MHHSGVHERLRDGDVDVEGAEGEVVAKGWHLPLAKTARIVKDPILRVDSLHQSRQHALAGVEEVARPDEDSSQRHCWPHGGRQISWWCHGICLG